MVNFFGRKIYLFIKSGRVEGVHSWGLVAQWITRLTTDQKIPGSNPGKVGLFVPIFSFKMDKKEWPVWGSNPRPSRY